MSTVPEIDPKEAQRRGSELTPVDVRFEHEFHGPLGRLPGSRFIPLPELSDRAAELPRDGALLLVCRSGQRSAKACAQLQALGFADVTNLAGGMIAWNQAGLPVERSVPESREAWLESLARWLAQVSAITPEAARDVLAERLVCLGASGRHPTTAALGQVLDFVEDSLAQSVAPADLDLTLDSFRRALEGL